MIVEMAGSPPEHVKETLTKHVGALKAFKDIKVNATTVSDPKEIENSNGIFTCFAEVDFENESFGRLCDTVFDFMPSSIEIIEPAKFSFSNLEASSLLNIISGRMHKYDEVARFSQFKMNQMASQMKALQESLIKKDEKKPAKEKKKKSKFKE